MGKKKAIVKKSNQLVNARFDFSVLEIRLFTLMVSQISNDDEDFATYKIPIQEFIKTFKIKNKNIYKELEKTTDSLIKKIIKIPIEEWGEQKLFKTSLINSFKYNIDGTGVIEATIHPDLKPYLLQLKSRFLMYDMKHVLNISSSNSIRMYELLKAFEGIGKRTFDVYDLKEILWVNEKYNNRYYNFKKRIILQAQKDLTEHTDISFTFKETKKPWTKKVDKITFYITTNKSSKSPNPSVQDVQNEWLFEDVGIGQWSAPSWLKVIKKYKFSQSIINHIVSTYDETYVTQTLKHCEFYFKKTPVPSPEWFIMKALEKDYYSDLIKEEESKKEKRVASEKKEDTQIEEEKGFQVYLHGLVEESLLDLAESDFKELKKAFLTKMEWNNFFKTALESYGFDHTMIQWQWFIFLREKLLTEEQRSMDFFLTKTSRS